MLVVTQTPEACHTGRDGAVVWRHWSPFHKAEADQTRKSKHPKQHIANKFSNRTIHLHEDLYGYVRRPHEEPWLASLLFDAGRRFRKRWSVVCSTSVLCNIFVLSTKFCTSVSLASFKRPQWTHMQGFSRLRLGNDKAWTAFTRVLTLRAWRYIQWLVVKLRGHFTTRLYLLIRIVQLIAWQHCFLGTSTFLPVNWHHNKCCCTSGFSDNELHICHGFLFCVAYAYEAANYVCHFLYLMTRTKNFVTVYEWEHSSSECLPSMKNVNT